MFGQQNLPPGAGGPGSDLANTGTVIASYTNYAGAQRAVDYLSDHEFPVENTAIVGADLRMVENVLGRLTAGKAAASGAASGAWFGLMIGLFLGIFAVRAHGWLWLVLMGLVWGIAAGALFGWLGYKALGGRRDFVSTSQIVASRYDVVVRPDLAERARNMVGRLDL
ncbi:general stress protein [Embleya sp. NPDC005575]|uniref:general stress protein n=1 Tax=Embleya sp. NPDC005575 TaxID=3156892 RepID=UPI0033BC012F